MEWLWWVMNDLFLDGPEAPRARSRRPRLRLEALEARDVPAVTATLTSGVLSIVGDNQDNEILVTVQASTDDLIVQNVGSVVGQFYAPSVTSISISTGNGAEDTAEISPQVLQAATIKGGTGKDVLEAGGGPTTIIGGSGNGSIDGGGSSTNTIDGGSGSTKIVGGTGPNVVTSGSTTTSIQNVSTTDTVNPEPGNPVLTNNPAPKATGLDTATLSESDVEQLLERATAADGTGGAIIAITDRNGRILGVRVDNNVSKDITDNTANLVFAIDGAVSLARTGAFFGNDQSPLTSRTVGMISQTTITEREVDSSPDVANQDSTLYGPGFVAPVEAGGHFPPGIANTPEVDLFGIELTNRSGMTVETPSGQYIQLPAAYNINPAYVPNGQTIYAPISYGAATGLEPDAQSRGIATLPGGIPIYIGGEEVGGIGVFFPGTTGYASAENSVLSATYNSSLPDLSEEAEYIAFAATGGQQGAGFGIGTINGVPAVPGVTMITPPGGGQIALAGVTLNLVGPDGPQGPAKVIQYGQSFGVESPNNGTFEPVTASGQLFQSGLLVPTGWLVTPHNGVGITAAQVTQIIDQGIAQAWQTRSQIRPEGSTARMVFCVCDQDGNIVGLYRMPDATVFSIDVAIAKARNDAYYDNPSELQPQDELPGIAAGTAFTSRTYRYLALPNFPSASQGPPGPWSIFNDGGVDTANGLQVGAPLPASAFQSVMGYAAFHPDANFSDPYNLANQNGVVFFPGSAPLYVSVAGKADLIGGFGVSGDGVDQDDTITQAGQVGFTPVDGVVVASEVYYDGVALPYQLNTRNPEGGIAGTD